MAPLHHHFEMKAWSETKIMVRFWIVAGILCAAGFALFYKYYPHIRPVKVLVYGLARSGRAAAARLAERGDEVVPVDRSLGNEDDLALLDGVELLVKSPGVPGERPLVEAARARGIPVWSELELGWQPARTGRHPLCRGDGDERQVDDERAPRRDLPRAPAGTSRSPGTSGRRSARSAAADWVSCEVSSLPARGRPRVRLRGRRPPQPRAGPPRPARLARGLPRREAADLRAGPAAPSSRAGSGLPGIEFAADDPLPAEPLMRGAHNRENAAAATAAARAAGVGDEAIAAALAAFPGVRHRLEPVGEAAGVRYVNDSKATNVAATLPRARGLRRRARAPDPRRLGQGRELRAARRGDRAERPLDPPRRRGRRARSPQSLAGREHDDAERSSGPSPHAAALARPGDVVLLSPACASYDQYGSYEERGDHFRRLVAAIPNG